MSNSIALAKHYAALLDKAYAAASLTAPLNVAPGFVREGANAGEFLIAKQSLVGLGDYAKATGFPTGDVTLAWETHSYSYDRGRQFIVDAMDNQESAGQAFGELAAEFLRTKVIPEVDAIRFATLATNAGTDAYGSLADSAAWVAAVDTGVAALGNAGVPMDNAILYVTYAGMNALKNSTAAARFTAPGANVDRRFAQWDGIDVVAVPSTCFYSAVTLDAGATAAAGGYTTTGDALNFILMDKGAAFADLKHAPVRIFDPNTNQDADAWKFQYRVYHDCFVLDNKKAGIYAHGVTEIS